MNVEKSVFHGFYVLKVKMIVRNFKIMNIIFMKQFSVSVIIFLLLENIFSIINIKQLVKVAYQKL